MIHVAYRLWGGDGYYAKMCGTSMLSMFEKTREKVTVPGNTINASSFTTSRKLLATL